MRLGKPSATFALPAISHVLSLSIPIKTLLPLLRLFLFAFYNLFLFTLFLFCSEVCIDAKKNYMIVKATALCHLQEKHAVKACKNSKCIS